ncbi:MAG: FAD-binding protein, partial [Gammaproteobacteria bacterium]|nr:FAD-binding protein [Gammaproteobacteria bacterium]
LMVGEHAQEGGLVFTNKDKMALPFDLPSFSLNSYSVKAFNSAYYGKVRKTVSEQKVSLDSFFYPLDAIDHWNRIYGKKGFLQYQFVLPLDQSYQGMEKVLTRIAASGKGSFLAVLKLFGKGNDNWLSFPMEGYTLSLDFKVESGVFDLFEELDKIVIDHGGRFYLAKDARITKNKFESGYRDIKKFRGLREDQKMNKKFNSLQSKRVGI